MRRIAVVDAPSNLGLRPPTASSVPGCAKAPGALRDSGLLARLGARDAGCITPPRYDPAGWQPGDGVAQADEIAVFVRRLADRIGAILASGDFPVVLGGDCSILLGAGLAMRRHAADITGDAAGRIGLVYVDAHSDFRHEGNASYVGAAAGEALALATGRGQSNLASIEQRRPYFRDVDVVLLGIRTHDEYRLDLQAAGIVARAVPELRSHGAARSAQWARDQLRDCAGFWVHVDVDVLDPAVMPAVDAPDVGGIASRELEILLSGLVSDPRCVGVQVTVFDPDYDPDGQYAREVTDVLVAGLEPLITSSALAAADLTPVVSAPPLLTAPEMPAPVVAVAEDEPAPYDDLPDDLPGDLDDLDDPLDPPAAEVPDDADLGTGLDTDLAGEPTAEPDAALDADLVGGPAAEPDVEPDAGLLDRPDAEPGVELDAEVEGEPEDDPADATPDTAAEEPAPFHSTQTLVNASGDPDDLASSAEPAVEVEPAPSAPARTLVNASAGDGSGVELAPVGWVDVRTGVVVDLATGRGAGRTEDGKTEAPLLPAYSRGTVIGITSRRPIDPRAEQAPVGDVDGGWVTVGGAAHDQHEPHDQHDQHEPHVEESAEETAEPGGALPFGRPGRKGRRAPRLALTLAPISAPPSSGRLARRADPAEDDGAGRDAVVPFVPAQFRTPVEGPEGPLTDVVPAARTPDEERTPKQH